MSECGMGVVHKIFHRRTHFTFKSECVQFKKCHESCLFPAVMHNVRRNLQEGLVGFSQKLNLMLLWNWCVYVHVCVWVPGPQTVDLMPVCSRTGTLLIAPSIFCMNTSQSRSNRLKANLSDTWEEKHKWTHDLPISCNLKSRNVCKDLVFQYWRNVSVSLVFFKIDF